MHDHVDLNLETLTLHNFHVSGILLHKYCLENQMSSYSMSNFDCPYAYITVKIG
jgi:hypothetical protein